MSDETDLLTILNAHGQNFLSSFAQEDLLATKKRKRAQKDDTESHHKARRVDEQEETDDEDAEEWHGFGGDSGTESDGSEEDEDGEGEDVSGDEDIEDDGFTASSSTQPRVPVVVFSDPKPSTSSSTLKDKTFMSSKVSKLREEVSDNTRKTKKSEQDLDDERTNAQNDALLHKLVHTQLLSGVANPDLTLKPAQRKKALVGRIQELAGQAKLGKGEKVVRAKEHNRAAKHIRDGMAEKQTERRQKQLAEAKDVGNYHPTIKKLFDDASEGVPARKRERGLAMGVGKFSGGMLKLSKTEIQSVNGPPEGFSRGRGNGRGRGRGRERGGGRGGGRSDGRGGGRGRGRGGKSRA